jgi:hypothetical protein
VLTLESDAGWCDALQNRIAGLGMSDPDIRHAPLCACGEVDWYDPARLPAVESVRLEFCDGPPGNTKGGRAGALAILAPRLPVSAVVMIDDTNREAEDRLSRDWSGRFQLERTRFSIGRDRAFDVLRSPSAV